MAMPESKHSFFIDVFPNGVYEDEDEGDVDGNDGEVKMIQNGQLQERRKATLAVGHYWPGPGYWPSNGKLLDS